MASWDCGPLEVAGTLAEGGEVAGFVVVELPGHSPGTIGLWREADRLALSNDCFAMFDVYTRSEEHTSELQSQSKLVCRLLLAPIKTATWGPLCPSHRLYSTLSSPA